MSSSCSRGGEEEEEEEEVEKLENFLKLSLNFSVEPLTWQTGPLALFISLFKWRSGRGSGNEASRWQLEET